jgi:hypothetical protein
VDSKEDGRTVPGAEGEIMEKLSEDKESASIRRVSSEAGKSLKGILGVQGVRRCQGIIRKEQEKCRQEEISPHAGAMGYETAIPKWDKKEQEMIAKGITPEPIHDACEMRARNWFLAHGGSYDKLTGDLICIDGFRIPRENWKKNSERN